MNKIQCAALVIVVFIGACMISPVFGEDRYIVHRDVPNKPAFSVIPFNSTQHQITCADYVEEALIYAGVKLVRLPSTSTVEIRTRADGRQVFEGREAQASEVRIEKFDKYDEEIKTDYVITTSGTWYYYKEVPYYEYIRIRIINNNTGEIVSSFETRPPEITDAVYNILKEMGIKVNPTPPQKGKKLETPKGKG